MFGNQGRAEHQWRQDSLDERGAGRGASLPPRGRLPKGSAPEPQRCQRTGRAHLGGAAWGEAGDATFSPEPPLESRRGRRGCDREAEKDPLSEVHVEIENFGPCLWISPQVHSGNAKVRLNRMSPNWLCLYNRLPSTAYRNVSNQAQHGQGNTDQRKWAG